VTEYNPKNWHREFLAHHQLPPAYLASAQQWFDPLAATLNAHRSGAAGPVLVGINGCQGSGKSTCCDYLRCLLEAEYGLRTVALSLDDFYLGHDERQTLAARIHPLFVTRGAPGTHDMSLLRDTLDALRNPGFENHGLENRGSHAGAPVAIPRFNKAADDRQPFSQWDQVSLPVDIILLEGWCLGVQPQTAAELAEPCNSLERDEDSEGLWRQYANERLTEDFLPLYARVDLWMMLKAPSFACVQRWRQEQENKLIAKLAEMPTSGGNRTMSPAALARFVQHYQRLTEHCLETLPAQMDIVLRLDEQRRIIACERRDLLACR
jgi:D-glycerate 3-kinase